MSTTGDIYSIYKRTFIAVLISMVMLMSGAYVLVYLMHPARSMSGVREIGHAVGGNDTTGSAAAAAAGASPADEGFALFLNGASADSEYLWIPIEDGITSSDITMENHYMDRQLWVSVSGGTADFYKEAYISGNLDGVSYACAVSDGERLILKFDMDRVYEYNTIFEDGVLYVEKLAPREVYDRIVVVDPAGYVPDELLDPASLTPARICQDISSKLLPMLENDDIRVYVTSFDERVASDEDSIALLTEVRPDMYIRIETSYDEDSKVYGTETVYNGTYFIPGFGSVELADLLESNVTTSIGGKASGLVEAGETDGVIRRATVPAASVRVGYYTNTQENILLNRDDYRTRIAEGIQKAIASAYESR